MIVYLSGAISNNLNYKRDFLEAKEKVEKLGHKTINPAELSMPKGCDKWEDYMIVCINLLSKADAIYMLKGYEKSKGAQIELLLAEGMHKIVIYASDKSGEEIIKWR